MADHRAAGRATTRIEDRSSAPRPPGTAPAEPSPEGSAARRTPPRLRGRLAIALRLLGAGGAGAALVTGVVLLAGATTGTSPAAARLATPAARISQAGGETTPAGTGTGELSAAALAALRQRAVSRDSARRVQVARADRRLERVAEAKVDARQAALATIDAQADQRSEEIARNTWVRPIDGGYHLTARFGQCSGLWSSCHTGLDFAAPSGTPIHSVASGTVTETGYDGAYGNKTVVTLEDGTELWYCHQTSVEVAVGDTVSSGQVIGTVGSTGNTTGPHLHLEVHPHAGDPVDPDTALADHGVTP